MVFVSGATIMKCHKLDGFKQEKFILIVLEARCMRSRYWEGQVLWEALRETVPRLSPGFRQLLASLDVFQLLDAPILSLHPMVLFVCIDCCVSFPVLHLEK